MPLVVLGHRTAQGEQTAIFAQAMADSVGHDADKYCRASKCLPGPSDLIVSASGLPSSAMASTPRLQGQ